MAATAISTSGETDTSGGLLDTDAAMRPFLDILKDGSSSNMNISTVRSLALKSLAHPHIFSGFDEFKSHCLQFLSPATGSHASNSLFHTLDLFSFGSLKDYKEEEQADEKFLPLNEACLTKLSQLTVLTCIQQACHKGEIRISYDYLAEALGLASVAMEDGSPAAATAIRDVEDVLIRCLYANVLKGKLCQRTCSFGWQGESLPVVSSRDVSSTQIPNLLAALQGLSHRLEESRKDVAIAQKQVTQGLEDSAQYWKAVQDQHKTGKDKSHSKGSCKSGFDNSGGQSSSSRFFGGLTGGFLNQRASGSPSSNPRRSSKRSRGGMGGNFLMDGGYRM